MTIGEYRENDDEVQETVESVARYIFGGDPIDAPYDLMGLHVFAVISSLREYDGLLYGEEAEKSLSSEEKGRRDEVEVEVGKAVDLNMQYYPFGHADKDRRRLASDDHGRLSASSARSTGITKTSARIASRRHVADNRRTISRIETERAVTNRSGKSELK